MIKGTDRNIPLSELHPFKDHPYKVEDNMEMDALCESIGKSGLLSPIIVRPRDEGGYEIISGHRRFRAYQRLGMTEIPSIVCEMSDEEAVVAMVDANLHRDHIFPSEKAFAYKMKLDAIKRQGERTDLTSAQLGQRLTSVEKIAAESDESKTQIQRYISLTRLIPEEKFARIIEKSAAHLQVTPDSDKIQAEYVLKSAGEEEYADQNQTE